MMNIIHRDPFVRKNVNSFKVPTYIYQEMNEPVYISLKEKPTYKKPASIFNSKAFGEDNKKIQEDKPIISNTRQYKSIRSFSNYFNITGNYVYKKLLLVIAPYTDLVDFLVHY